MKVVRHVSALSVNLPLPGVTYFSTYWTTSEAGQYVGNVLCTVVLWWLGKEEGALMKDQEPYRAD